MGRALWAGLGSAAGTAVLAGAGVLGWSVKQTSAFTLRRYDVPVLAPGTSPVKLLHISDLHLVPTQRKKVAWVQRLAELAPDLVINTGDNMADGASLPTVTEALDGLLDVPGAFVLGSNDYYAPRLKNPARYLLADARKDEDPEDFARLPAEAMVEAFTDRGWLDLSNARGRLVVGGVDVRLVGVDDPHLERDVMPAPEGAGGGAGGGVGAAAPVLRLGVAHAPYTRVLDAFADDGADLILAGHTHGGQLCLPGGRALVTNCDLDPGRASGLHGWPGPRPDRPDGAGSTWLHVSAGLGTSPYAPVRFACPPEATLLTLVARN